MTPQEKQLVDAINAKPNHQVWPNRSGGGVQIAVTRSNGVKIISVWFGRSQSVQQLQDILSA
jgi:hypothetical protein